MMGRDIGPLLVVVGLMVVLVGVLAWNGWLSWFGHGAVIPKGCMVDQCRG